MEFLKSILGDELYQQLEAKINEHNTNNKDKQIKIANLGDGGYVDKNKYSSLETEKASKIAELEQANNLIKELQKGTKGNEALQTKITNYENEVQALKETLYKEQVKHAIEVNLLSAKATDLDYLTFKLNALGDIKLNDKGEIENWNDKLSSLKVQFPQHFEASTQKEFKDGQLPQSDNQQDSLTKKDILSKSYNERVALYEANPEAYNNAMKK